jgi:nucleoside-diphosphate-sugar epimerase
MIIVTGGSGKAGKTCVWDLQEHGYDVVCVDLVRPINELSELYAGVPRKRGFGPNETLLSIEKARRVLGYEPRYSWRASIK